MHANSLPQARCQFHNVVCTCIIVLLLGYTNTQDGSTYDYSAYIACNTLDPPALGTMCYKFELTRLTLILWFGSKIC